MKASQRWLSEWVQLPEEAAKLTKQLTMAGLEVDDVQPALARFSGIVIGEILTVQAHPEAEKLTVCMVDIGAAQPLQIVCGASNVKPTMRVPVAIAGASLVNRPSVEESALRGIKSQGFLCSLAELGLAETAEEVWRLPEAAPIGEALWDWLQLDDQIIELAITPNRGDCCSVLGLAREIAALNRIEMRQRPAAVVAVQDVAQAGDPAVHLESLVNCPRYVGRVIRGIDQTAQSPVWLTERLRRCGIRAISPVVDVANYVMLELGQPMHSFDLAQLSGDIHVRLAKTDEELQLLDGQTAALSHETLIIADDIKPLAIAGVMGGLQSSVTATTQDIFLESAFFNQAIIAGKTRHYGIQSDAAFRFERGVDFELPVIAMQRAIELLVQIVGGQVGPLIVQQDLAYLPQLKLIELRRSRIAQLVGITISDAEIVAILKYLELKVVSEHNFGWQIQAPSHRFDIALEIDLIEEIARLYGYDNIAPQTSALPPHSQAQSVTHSSLNSLRQLLVAHGYHEAITYSFVDPELQTLLAGQQAQLTLVNPISPELSVMRTSLWPGLLTTLLYNQNRQQNRVRLFETGLRFIADPDSLRQEQVLAGLISGYAWPEQWGASKREVDFFDIKNDVQMLLSLMQYKDIDFVPEANLSALHPGQSAAILAQGKTIGHVGKLHPEIAQKLSIDKAVYLFELSLIDLPKSYSASYKAVTKFPIIRRDLSLLLDKTIPFQAVATAIEKSAGDLLQQLELFDVYQGKGVPITEKSLAISLSLQDSSRTLRDEQVNDLISCVVANLQQTFNARLRE